MRIDNDKLVGDGQFLAGASFRGRLYPIGIVLHDTAGRLTKHQTAEWMASDETTSSYHVIIERDGSWSQLVPFDSRAHHAGESYWKGKSGLNRTYLGIAFVSPGRLTKKGRGGKLKNAGLKSYFGVRFPGGKHAPDHRGKSGWWLDYTPAQIRTATLICRLLVETYPSVKEIVTHYDVAPNRKEDVNPLFPLEAFRASVFAESGTIPSPELATAPPQPTIELGDADAPDDLEGPVYRAQMLLMELYYWGGAHDGQFGDLMQVQVMSFQKQNNLDVDGVIGPKTWAALESMDAKAFPTGAREESGKEGFAATNSKTKETAEATELATSLSAVGGLASITKWSEVATAWQDPLEALKGFSEFMTTGLIPFLFSSWRVLAFVAVMVGAFFMARRIKNIRFKDWLSYKHVGR